MKVRIVKLQAGFVPRRRMVRRDVTSLLEDNAYHRRVHVHTEIPDVHQALCVRITSASLEKAIVPQAVVKRALNAMLQQDFVNGRM